MKYSVSLNQKRAIELGITNINQALILDLLCSCSTWATPVSINGKVYYWVSRQSICRELPILGIKEDTAYRHLKKLSELGLIEYLKAGKKDLIVLTEMGKSYYVGNESEKHEKLGNESELLCRKQIRKNGENSEMNPKNTKNSEMNPTDHNNNNIIYTTSSYNNNNNINIRDKKQKTTKFKKPTPEEIQEYCDERGNGISGSAFYDSNEAKGWVVGTNRTPMKDWKAAIRTWERNSVTKKQQSSRLEL